MSIIMNCPSCGKNLAAPDGSSGKKAKCPTCGQIMVVPDIVHDAEEFGSMLPEAEPAASAEGPGDFNNFNEPATSPGDFGPAAEWLNALQGGGSTPAAAGPGGDARRPCPECGEMILVRAVKCRFCGAVFDSRLRHVSRAGGQSYNGFAITSMILGIVSLFTLCFGIVFGIVAIIFSVIASQGMNRTRNFEGKGMATAGMVMGLLSSVGYTLLYIFILANAPRGGRW
jgi:predicted RNA-binding Zn-ribbon protein involved in translation (DUF1610 family)